MIALMLALLLAPGPAFAPVSGCASAGRQEIKSDDVVTVLETRHQKVAQKVGPAVVAIRVEREPEPEKEKKNEKRPRGPLGRAMAEAEDLFAKRPANSWCSGTVIEADGVIATTAFNVSGKVKSVTVRLSDGRELEAKILGMNAT